MTDEELLALRLKHISRSLSMSYREPLHLVRGSMQYLYDAQGREYLDAVNNVAHVGHCHPKVVAVAQQQIALLNTNTRYLHENLVRYAQRLTAFMPESLSVCFFVNSGSEANELAIRLARTHTGEKDMIVLEGGYHGNTSTLIELSSYKFDRLPGKGAAQYVHKVPLADPYRGVYKRTDPKAGEKYAAFVAEATDRARGLCGFLHESMPSSAGQIVFPEGYLREAYRTVRNAGGVCIADEVQTGFGRLGSHFWGFETQDVVPDIVTLGKPIGNGHPMGAVITTRAIAESFANGMEFFSTFGGNPVSCAIGLAVLDVIVEEQLQQNAKKVGDSLLQGLLALQKKHPLIGDVRGMGLYIGVELVTDRQDLTPAAAQASHVVNRMKERGILISTDGMLENVLKIRPPMVFNSDNVDFLISNLDVALGS